MKQQFKANNVMQQTECNWNKTFVILPPLPWKSEISGAIHLAQLGLTAGRQADEIQMSFEIHCNSETFAFSLRNNNA